MLLNCFKQVLVLAQSDEITTEACHGCIILRAASSLSWVALKHLFTCIRLLVLQPWYSFGPRSYNTDMRDAGSILYDRLIMTVLPISLS